MAMRSAGIASVAALMALLLVVSAEAGSKPQVVFKKDGIRVKAKKGRSNIVWLAVVRDRPNDVARVRVPKGTVVANDFGDADVTLEKAHELRGIWLVADVDEGAAGFVSPALQTSNPGVISVDARKGLNGVAVTAPDVVVMFVRPRVGAWTFSVTDGSPADGDRAQNGVVVVPLSSLVSFEGKKKPPAVTEPGDLVLAVDRRWMRVGEVEVMP
jgi:hypothetical protein